MSPNSKEAERYLEFRQDELNSAELYQALAEMEKNPKLAEVYQRLAATERGHAETWARKMTEAGAAIPPFRPTFRTRLLIALARRFGPELVLPTMISMEKTGVQGYSGKGIEREMAATEHSHSLLLQQISRSAHGGLEGSAVARLEGRHRSVGGNALRAAVLGANDGLVSIFMLIMGVAGAAMTSTAILLTGLAGLLAGAISMALGEWISVQSSRELFQRQILIEKEEIESAPEEEIAELALIYQARGMQEAAAIQLAEQIMSDRENALQVLSQDELGIDPEELGGSAWEAAITSFLLFAMGGILPVIPFAFLSGLPAIALSAALSAVGLFIVGAAITLFSGRSVFYSGMRQVIFGLLAAAMTYLIGRFMGVSVS